jgi:hypothetical protein
MPQIAIDTSDFAKLAAKLGAVDKKERAIAINTGLRLAANQGKTEAKRGITAGYSVKSSAVGARLKVTSNHSKLEASVEAETKKNNRIPLIDFKPSQTKSGVTFAISKAKGRGKLRHGFIAKMPSGHIGVYVRESATSRKIKEVKTIDVPQMMTGAAVRPAVEKKMQEAAIKTISNQLKWRLARLV